MSETKSQTPETDAALKRIEDDEKCYPDRYDTYIAMLDHARSLEISRDQWKAVAERLADAVTNRRARCQALTEFNQLKSTTEKK